MGRDLQRFGQDVMEWAERTFGPVARDRRERALRLVEEAVEVAQAEGVDPLMLRRTLERVLARPAGDTGTELGAVVMTLAALAANIGIDLDRAGEAEWSRVQELNPGFLAARHRNKIYEGCAVDPEAP